MTTTLSLKTYFPGLEKKIVHNYIAKHKKIKMSEIARKRFGLLKILAIPFRKAISQTNSITKTLYCTYENFDIQEIDSFTEILKNNADLKGLSVTIPTNKPYFLLHKLSKKAALISKHH
jgi:shikimate dehydrogenase